MLMKNNGEEIKEGSKCSCNFLVIHLTDAEIMIGKPWQLIPTTGSGAS